eukprot:TRINITY_DN19767_c0_g1_i1.p1 TRINITY_DN19767_c0_g1~~TRINITY_DN19767_c0_g1_i1.p1  ORF type:complete len:300 (-),score=23.23 TRINITY_DN19767_c0_g1_i1:28-927(-)
MGSVVRHLSVFAEPTSSHGPAIFNHVLYFTNSSHHVVDVINSCSGVLISRWGVFNHSGSVTGTNSSSLSSPTPLFSHPYGIAFSPSHDRIFIADKSNHRVVVLRRIDGSLEASWGSQGDGLNHFKFPCGLAVSASNNLLYVSDQYNHCVKGLRLTDGAFLQVLGSGKGNGPDQMNGPYGVAVDEKYVYIADTGNHRVLVYNQSDGRAVQQLGEGRGSGENQFDCPSSVSVDAELGLLYVADYNNYRVSVWDTMNGSYVRQWGVMTPNKAKARPDSVVWDNVNRALYVTLPKSVTVCVFE